MADRSLSPYRVLTETGYTIGMKTAISIPDAVFQQAEDLAARQGKTRSRLYTEALVAYLGEQDPDTVTKRVDEVLAAVDGAEDRWVSDAAKRTLRDVEW